MNAGGLCDGSRSHGETEVAVLQEEIHMIHHANELYWRHTKPSDADGGVLPRRIGWRRSARVGWTASEIMSGPQLGVSWCNQVIAYITAGTLIPALM